MAEKPVQEDEGTSSSSSISASVSVSVSRSTSAPAVSVPVSPSSSAYVSVSALRSTSAPVWASAPPSTSTSVAVSAPFSTSTSVSVAASASAFVSALALSSVSTTASTLVSASALTSLSELASAAWSTDSTSATSTTRITESASTSSAACTLADELPIKLEGVGNLVAWKEQVMRVLNTEDLLGFVTNPVTPIKYASEVDCACDIVREEYQQWVIQDQKLRTWLLSSLSEFIRSFVTGWEHAWEVWSGVHEICRNELVSKIKIALRAEIKNTKKEDQSVKDYITRITSLIGALVALGDDVTEQEHVEAILEGLSEDFDSLRNVVRARGQHTTVSHLESLMLIQETLVNNLNNELPLNSLLPLGSLHLVTPGSANAADGAGRGRGSGQGDGRGRRRSGGRRRGGRGGSN